MSLSGLHLQELERVVARIKTWAKMGLTGSSARLIYQLVQRQLTSTIWGKSRKGETRLLFC
jgi:hypothetical protein